MRNTIYGYVKISEIESDVDGQLAAIRDYGVEDSCIYIDRISLENPAFPAYQTLLERIRPGDTIVLKSFDLPGDTWEDIISQWRRITTEHGTAIVVQDMTLPDTAKALNPQFVSELVLDILGYMAQNRRELRRQKQSEGITAAHRRGVKFGRPTKKDSAEFEKVKNSYKNGEISSEEAARRLNISRGTFYKWLRNETSGEKNVSERTLKSPTAIK
ncbi:MAG: recombinase family protein [Clostridiales bacterium]|nr:recombinase family protein [Clostridiales bacterium]